MDEKIKKIVQNELKKAKLLITVLLVINMISTILNLSNSYQYKKILYQEKVFINRVQNILLNLKR